MKSRSLKSAPTLPDKRKALEEQIVKEVMLLNEFNPDEELIADFEHASLVDLQKYLDEEEAI